MEKPISKLPTRTSMYSDQVTATVRKRSVKERLGITVDDSPTYAPLPNTSVQVMKKGNMTFMMMTKRENCLKFQMGRLVFKISV